MGKKILDSKLLYALLAIVIAIALWFYVSTVESTGSEMTITGVPITFLNEDVLEAKGLMITEGKDQTVTLTVNGPLTTLVNLDREKENIALSIDVGKITTSGEQRMAYMVTLPTGYNSTVDVTGQSPNNIDFTVSRRIKKNVEVEGKFTGQLASSDYMRGDFVFLPETIEVSGIESEVNQIAHALVTVGGEDLTETVTGDLPFVLIGYQGEELENLDVTCSTETVYTTMPVVKTADVPLNVKLVTGNGVPISDEYVSFDIEPKFITVSGEEDDVDPLKEIMLGEIDLSNIITSDTFEFDIPLNSALTNISGETTAKVTVIISGLMSKVLEVDNIQLNNVPDGFQAESVTKTLQVLVRGPEEAAELVLSHNLRVVADLRNVDAAVGRYTVPAKVYLDGTRDVGVVGDDYKVVVDIFVPGKDRIQ